MHVSLSVSVVLSGLVPDVAAQNAPGINRKSRLQTFTLLLRLHSLDRIVMVNICSCVALELMGLIRIKEREDKHKMCSAVVIRADFCH